MKSLEIVRESISKIKNKIEKLIPTKACNNTLPIERVVKSLIKNLENQIIIEKDLEVLEIIINKKINIENIKTKLECWENLEALLEMWNSLTSHKDSQLTMEELIKLKQYLEREEESKC